MDLARRDRRRRHAGPDQGRLPGARQAGRGHAGSGPLLLAAADTVRRSGGGEVAAIVEYRGTRELAAFTGQLALAHRAKLAQAALLFARLLGIPYLRGASVRAALGENQLRAVQLEHDGNELDIDCDFLACGFGLVLRRWKARGCSTARWRAARWSLTTTRPPAWRVCGRRASRPASAESTRRWPKGALPVWQRPGCRSRKRISLRAGARAFGELLAASFAPPDAMRQACQPSTIVCRCEDVRAAELEPHDSWRSAKLQTRA
ncbi:hypothetical protein LP420_31795 [Massilia sp. B-10]|nr:hypothetical protein LP420_31795 [Massilia sp. B-10]